MIFLNLSLVLLKIFNMSGLTKGHRVNSTKNENDEDYLSVRRKYLTSILNNFLVQRKKLNLFTGVLLLKRLLSYRKEDEHHFLTFDKKISDSVFIMPTGKSISIAFPSSFQSFVGSEMSNLIIYHNAIVLQIESMDTDKDERMVSYVFPTHADLTKLLKKEKTITIGYYENTEDGYDINYTVRQKFSPISKDNNYFNDEEDNVEKIPFTLSGSQYVELTQELNDHLIEPEQFLNSCDFTEEENFIANDLGKTILTINKDIVENELKETIKAQKA